MTKDILDYQGNKIGEMTLPDGTPDEVWAEKLSAYSQPPAAALPETVIMPKVSASFDCGEKIMQDFVARTLVAGKTADQIDAMFDNADVQKIAIALMAGSLHYAKRKVAALVPFDGISADDKAWLIDQLDLAIAQV